MLVNKIELIEELEKANIDLDWRYTIAIQKPQYYVPKWETLAPIIANFETMRPPYGYDNYNCLEFSERLRADIALQQWSETKGRRPPIACGIIKGVVNGQSHAMNVLLLERGLVLVEAQVVTANGIGIKPVHYMQRVWDIEFL